MGGPGRCRAQILVVHQVHQLLLASLPLAHGVLQNRIALLGFLRWIVLEFLARGLALVVAVVERELGREGWLGARRPLCLILELALLLQAQMIERALATVQLVHLLHELLIVLEPKVRLISVLPHQLSWRVKLA